MLYINLHFTYLFTYLPRAVNRQTKYKLSKAPNSNRQVAYSGRQWPLKSRNRYLGGHLCRVNYNAHPVGLLMGRWKRVGGGRRMRDRSGRIDWLTGVMISLPARPLCLRKLEINERRPHRWLKVLTSRRPTTDHRYMSYYLTMSTAIILSLAALWACGQCEATGN